VRGSGANTELQAEPQPLPFEVVRPGGNRPLAVNRESPHGVGLCVYNPVRSALTAGGCANQSRCPVSQAEECAEPSELGRGIGELSD